MGVIETNIESIWFGAQARKGTPATRSQKHMRKVGGDVDLNRADASENFSDLDQFGDAQDWVDSISGVGTAVIQATPGDLAYLLWLFMGTEAVTTAGTDQRHVYRFGASVPKWFTVWKRVGNEIAVRQRFHDCRLSSMSVEAASGAKLFRVTLAFTSLYPGEPYDAVNEPAVAQDPEDGFLLTEGEGNYLVDGVAMPISRFQFTLDRALSPVAGDGVRPIELAPGNAQITCGAEMTINEQGIAHYNTQIYGRAAPAEGDRPITTIPPIGSLRATLTRTTPRTRSFMCEIPGVKWSPDIPIAGSPDGGAATMTMSGAMRKVPGQPAITIEIVNGDAAYTVPV